VAALRLPRAAALDGSGTLLSTPTEITGRSESGRRPRAGGDACRRKPRASLFDADPLCARGLFARAEASSACPSGWSTSILASSPQGRAAAAGGLRSSTMRAHTQVESAPGVRSAATTTVLAEPPPCRPWSSGTGAVASRGALHASEASAPDCGRSPMTEPGHQASAHVRDPPIRMRGGIQSRGPTWPKLRPRTRQAPREAIAINLVKEVLGSLRATSTPRRVRARPFEYSAVTTSWFGSRSAALRGVMAGDPCRPRAGSGQAVMWLSLDACATRLPIGNATGRRSSSPTTIPPSVRSANWPAKAS
jgi:hypothetical protein